MQALNFSQIQTLVFTGGGNRCWWQAGLLTQMQACGAHLPATLVGTSAGAAIAASFLAGSVAAGTLAYLVDKKLLHNIHPALPRFLGLKQAFFALQDCSTAQEAQTTLQAAAAAPPFMSGVQLQGEWAFDGGYTDNAPIPAQTASEKAATLVLLTRHYPDQAALIQAYGRTYWQPSRKVPVSTWDCRPGTTVEDAFTLGQDDARRALADGQIQLSI